MPLVELVRRSHVLRVGCGARLLVTQQRGLEVRWEQRAQLGRLLDPLRDARRRAGHHQRRETVRMRQCVFHGQHPAPRVAEHVDMAQPEPFSDRTDLLDEQLDGVERRFVRPHGMAATDLVVEHGAPPGLRESLQRLQVVVRRSRSPVQAEHGKLPRSVALTNHTIPRFVVAEREVALSHLSTSNLPPISGVGRKSVALARSSSKATTDT